MVKTVSEQILTFLNVESYREFVIRLLIALLTLFTPIAPILLCIVFFVILDFITAIIASVKNKIAITSSKMSRTVSKTIVYSISIIVTHLLDTIILKDFNLHISLASISGAFIAITEGKSILENLILINNGTALKNILLYLSSEYRHTKNSDELFDDIASAIKKNKIKKEPAKYDTVKKTKK